MTEQARNFYGRIKGKALKPAQKRYLDEDLPALELHGVNREENPDRQTVDAKGFFRPAAALVAGNRLWGRRTPCVSGQAQPPRSGSLAASLI